MYFKRYIFILCAKIFRFIGNLKCQISEKAFCPKNDIIFVAGAGAPPSLPPTARTPLVIWLHLRGNISSEGPVSRRSRNVFAHRKPYLFRDVLPAHALNMNRCSYVYTSLFLDTDSLKMAFWARKISGAFEKRNPVWNTEH